MALRAYTRVSTDIQVKEGESLTTQKMQITGYVMQKFLKTGEDIEYYQEEGESGSVPVHKRKVGMTLLDDVQKGDIVIITKLDRMFRSSLDALATLNRFKEIGADLHIIELGGSVITDVMGKAFFTVAAAFAELEREKIKQRIIDVKQVQKGRNEYLGGDTPFGYTKISNEFKEEVVHTQSGTEVVKKPVYVIKEDPVQQEVIRVIKEKREPTDGSKPMSLRKLSDYISEHYDIVISHQGIKRIIERNGAAYMPNTVNEQQVP